MVLTTSESRTKIMPVQLIYATNPHPTASIVVCSKMVVLLLNQLFTVAPIVFCLFFVWYFQQNILLTVPRRYFFCRSFIVFFLSCVCYAFVRVCLYVPCGHLLGKS